MSVFNASLLDIIYCGSLDRLPTVAFFGHDTCCTIDFKDSFGQCFVVCEGLTGLLKIFVRLCCAISATILQDELVHIQLFILASKQPNCNWPILRSLSNSLPNIILVDVDFPALWEVELFGPSVTIVDNELNISISITSVFVSIIDIFACNVF